jgi:hypothetical protein
MYEPLLPREDGILPLGLSDNQQLATLIHDLSAHNPDEIHFSTRT